MLESLREETEGKLQMPLSLRRNGLTSLFKDVRVFKVSDANTVPFPKYRTQLPLPLNTSGQRLSGPRMHSYQSMTQANLS